MEERGKGRRGYPRLADQAACRTRQEDDNREGLRLQSKVAGTF